MDHTPPPPPPCTTSIPAAATSGSSPSSAMLGLSSSAHSRRRRFSPSLYPSPAPPLPGRLASGPGSGSSSSCSSSRFQHVNPPPPPPPMAAVDGRPQIKRGLPTPFLSELCAIRRMGASLFGDLETRATAAAAVQRNATRSAAPLLGWHQLPPPSPTASRVAGTPTLLPSGRSFSDLAPPVPRQPPLSSTGMPPMPCPSFSGSWNAPPPASQQHQAQPSPSDLAVPVHSRSFSGGFAPLPALQPLFTDLAPVPSESFSSGFVWPRHSETTSASSSWSAPPCSVSDTMYLDEQPLLSDDSQLQPLPQSLQMQSDDLMPFCQQPSGSGNDLAPLPSGSLSGFTFTPRQLETTTNGRDILYGNAQPLTPSLEMQSDGTMMPLCQPSGGNNGTSGFVQPASGSESLEFGHDAMPMTTQDTPPLFQVKQEPIDAPAPWVQLQPELISLDDDDDDGLSALLHSFKSSSEPASLATLEPTSSQDRLHIGGTSSSSGPSAWATVEGSCESWEAMLTLASTLDKVVNTGGNNTCGTNSIPWNCHMSMSQQQAPHHMGEQFCSSPASSDMAAQWQTSQSNTSKSLFVKPQPLHPSSTDRLQLNSSRGPSVWTTANSSGQGCSSAMPEALLASKFGQMSIGGGSMSGIVGQGWQETTPPAAASNFDMIIGVSGSSTSAGATMPWNISSSSMEKYSTPVPKLRLEKPRLAPGQISLHHGAGASMLRSGAHGDFFSEDEMRTINKEKRLKELVNTDPKRVKRILSNRASAAQLKARKANYALDLQHRAEALNMEYLSLFTQVQSHQERYVDLKTQNSEMQVKLQVLNEQASLKEALNCQLRSEIQRLKLLDELNMLRAMAYTTQ